MSVMWVDPVLWEALAEDRAECPYQPWPRAGRTVPEACADCGRKVRPRGALKVDHPDTIAYHSNGQCGECHKKAVRAQELTLPRVRG